MTPFGRDDRMTPPGRGDRMEYELGRDDSVARGKMPFCVFRQERNVIGNVYLLNLSLRETISERTSLSPSVNFL